MNQRKKTEKKIEKRQRSFPFPYYVLMIPMIMGLFLPLIVHGYRFEIASVFSSVSLTGGGLALDVFLHGKQIWLYWTAGGAIFLLLCFILLERKVIYPKRWMIFGGIYLLGTLVSAFHAADLKTAFFGGEDLFQGFFAILSYFILFYYAYVLFCGEKEQRTKIIFLFLRCILVLSLILMILGIFQICGNDPFSWKWVKALCNISGTQIIENKKIYLTLYNSNYVGVMTVMLLPLLMVGVLSEKTKQMKILFAITFTGMACCLVASGSKTALVLVVFFMVMGCIVAFRKKQRIVGIVLLFVVVIGVATIFMSINSEMKSNQVSKQGNALKMLSTQSDCLQMKVGGQQLRVTWNREKIQFENEKGEIYDTKNIGKKKRKRLLEKLPSAMTSYYAVEMFQPKRVADARFRKVIFFKSGIRYQGKNVEGYVFYISKKAYFITNTWKIGEYYYYNLNNQLVKVCDSEDAFDKSMYHVASNRGYIWSKTIPLLKKTIFYGVGMNHFSLLFPNHDYAAKAQINQLGMIYNKPHSWYLQMGTESGVIALLSMIIMITYIFLEGAKKMKEGKANSKISGEEHLLKMMIMGLGISILGYCFMNILNDEMIVTAPVFWLILGAYAGISHCFRI